MTNITDKAIFQLPERQPKLMGFLFNLTGIGLLAPADQYIVFGKRHAGFEGM
ncbi:hypothetical protein D3C76_1793870 [compost metagenome]